MFAIGLDIGYSNLKLAFGKVSDNGLAKPAVTRVLPAGAGRLSDLPLRMGKADGDTDALVVNVNGEKWAAGVDQARLETSVRELHADYPASDAYRALFHAALLMGEHETVDQLITGLPVSQFLDKDLRARLSDRLTGEHQVTAGRTITVKNTLTAILTDWSLPEGGLYFITPSARTRPAEVGVLTNFFGARLSEPAWRRSIDETFKSDIPRDRCLTDF